MRDLPSPIARLKQETHAFVDESLLPRISEIDERGELPDDLVAEIRARGYFGINTPKEHGGLGFGMLATVAVLEELARGHSALPALLNGNLNLGSKGLLLAGTEEQKARYLRHIATGECLTAFALTEPNAGSDAARIQTRAARDGSAFVVNGSKHFITGADRADLFTVFAVTDSAKGAKGGITAFLIERGTPGLRIGARQTGMAGGPVHQCELHLEDCRVPAAQILGDPGWGFAVAMKTIDDGRLITSAYALGLAKRALEISLAWAKARVQFGQTISSFQLIRTYLAQMATRTTALESFLYDVAERRDRGGPMSRESAMVKLMAEEVSAYVVDRGVQIHGGRGWMRGWEIERLYREARLFSLIEGTTEILNLVVARELLNEASAHHRE